LEFTDFALVLGPAGQEAEKCNSVENLKREQTSLQQSIDSLEGERENFQAEVAQLESGKQALIDDYALIFSANNQALQNLRHEVAQWLGTKEDAAAVLNAIKEAENQLMDLESKCTAKRNELQTRERELGVLNIIKAMLLDAPSWDFDPLYGELTDLKRVRDGEAPHLKEYTLSMKARVRRYIISLLRKAGEEDIISRWDLHRETRLRDRLIIQLKQENTKLRKELEEGRQEKTAGSQLEHTDHE